MFITKGKLLFFYVILLFSIITMLIISTNLFTESPFKRAHPEVWIILPMWVFTAINLRGFRIKV
jgi:hypothetical protein